MYTLIYSFHYAIKKQGFFPCFSFVHTFVWIVLLGFWILRLPLSSHSQETITNFSSRQQICLEQISESKSTPEFERYFAMCVQKTNLKEANRHLILMQPDELNFARCTVLLRILLQDNSGEILTDAVRMELENTVAKYIQDSLPLLTYQNNSVFEPESLQLAKAMILYSWCLYTESTEKTYEWFPEKKRGQVLQNQVKRIHSLLDNWLKRGFVMRGSHEYLALLTSLCNLYDLSSDEELRIKSAALADVILSEIALENIDGAWGGVRQNTLTMMSPVSLQWMLYLMFGTPMPSNTLNIDPGIIILCNTKYPLPPLLEKMGRNHERRGIYELKHRYFTQTDTLDKKEEVRKYSYITPSYILSSFQMNNQTVPWQARPWDLMIADKQQTGTHVIPFAGEQLYSGNDPLLDEEYAVWKATNLQYKNVLFCQFHKASRLKQLDEVDKSVLIPNFEQLPSRIWIPNSLAPIEYEDEWRFINTGKVFVAMRPLPGTSYWWRTAEAGAGSAETASILSFRDLYAGMLIEVEAESARISSYNEFKQQVVDAPLVIDEQSVTFVSRRGDIFYFPRKPGGEFLVNGNRIDAASDPEYELFSNPFIQSEWNSGYYEAKWSAFSLLIDVREPDKPIRKINTN